MSVLQDQPSPAAVANAVRQALSAEQSACLPAFNSLASVSFASVSGGVSGPPTDLNQLDSQALSSAAFVKTESLMNPLQLFLNPPYPPP